MKALLILSGIEVDSYVCEDGTEERRVETNDAERKLSAWFAHGWKIHGGLPTNANGSALVVLRDGKPVASWGKSG